MSLNEDTRHPVTRAIGVSHAACKYVLSTKSSISQLRVVHFTLLYNKLEYDVRALRILKTTNYRRTIGAAGRSYVSSAT